MLVSLYFFLYHHLIIIFYYSKYRSGKFFKVLLKILLSYLNKFLLIIYRLFDEAVSISCGDKKVEVVDNHSRSLDFSLSPCVWPLSRRVPSNMSILSDILRSFYLKYQHHLITSGDILLDFDIIVVVLCIILFIVGWIGTYIKKSLRTWSSYALLLDCWSWVGS